MSAEAYKQITVEDFRNPKMKAVFTLETKGDLLVKVQTMEDGLPAGPAVRVESSALLVVGRALGEVMDAN